MSKHTYSKDLKNYGEYRKEYDACDRLEPSCAPDNNVYYDDEDTRHYLDELDRFLDKETSIELMNDEGRVMAFDLHENRVKLIKSGAERLGLKSVSAAVNNAKEHNESLPAADKVLCDVPCLGLGVIRRKPEIKYKPEEELERLPEIQLDILKTSAAYVRTGGILVYSTCSLSKAENDDVVQSFLSENADFEPVPLGELGGRSFDNSQLTVFPDMFDSDGFFIAKFRRLR